MLLTLGLVAIPARAAGAGVTVTAADVGLGPEYWQGPTQGDLVVTVRPTGPAPADVAGTIFLPTGIRLLSGTGTEGCALASGSTYTCALGQDTAPGQIALRVEVDADAWRFAPLVGNVTATLGSATDRDSFVVALPPGPPAPGVTLAVDDLAVPAPPHNLDSQQPLLVRLDHANPAPVSAALELVTPRGVDILQIPAICGDHRRINGSRDRCELGHVLAGQEIQLTFDVLISAQATAEAPLNGAVFVYVTPEGQETAIFQVGYRIALAAPGSEPASVNAPGSASTLPSASERTPIQPARGADDRLLGDRGSVLSLIGVALSAVAVAGVLVFASLRRRLRDEPEVPPDR
ncbi:MAG: hypothetical protein KJO75_18975 [Dactylosporangium sp.]|nr:hypothetical protein [Dactylosporangium sp.]